jgi:S-formylglutathione hydrolase FrmB
MSLRRRPRAHVSILLFLAMLYGAVLTAGPASATSPVSPATQGVGPDALVLQSSVPVDDRMTDYTFSTPDLPGTTVARVMLPTSYVANPAQRYPVLYLLPGCCDPGMRQSRWSDPNLGDAERLTAGKDVIVVMPEGDLGSWYTDWANAGTQGQYLWESYLVDQLVPLVDSSFRTTAGRSGRAIAGLSMGGYGALAIASRHPDLFTAVASFSGFPNTNDNPQQFTDVSTASGGQPNSLWGDRATDQVTWRGHDPTDLAGNLGGVLVYLAAGNGTPGPLPDPNTDPTDIANDEAKEKIALKETLSLTYALRAAKVPVTLNRYGKGVHAWPYWRRDLQQFLPVLMKRFAAATSAPATFTFKAPEPTFSAWGYSVTMTRKVTEFATVSGVTSSGLTLTGSGSAVVTTAPRYTADGQYQVTVVTKAGTTQLTITASDDGRLTVPIVLGASNTVQQYLPNSTWKRTLEKAAVTIAAG